MEPSIGVILCKSQKVFESCTTKKHLQGAYAYLNLAQTAISYKYDTPYNVEQAERQRDVKRIIRGEYIKAYKRIHGK